MTYPTEIFPSSKLPARLANHTKTVTTVTPMYTYIKQVADPIKLEGCEKVRVFQYDCQLVPLYFEGKVKKVDKAVRCVEIERQFWRCGKMMIEDPSLASQWANRKKYKMAEGEAPKKPVRRKRIDEEV